MLRGRNGIGWMVVCWLAIAVAMFLSLLLVTTLSGQPIMSLW